jgi:tetratricopeptide (TPR) repeat protein
VARGSPGAVRGAAVTDATAARVGASMARYVVIEEIGRGGMGRVLRAYDPKLQREVALKEVHGAALGTAGAQRLVREARAMAKLAHPCVVAVYDVAEVERERFVLVMEYVAGQTLTAWLSEPRSWRDVVACFREAGRGLAAAHAAGLLHRDFKPDNVLVGSDGRVRVTDFGLAREVMLERTAEPPADDAAPPPPEAGERTVTGAVVGTLPYLAPERLMGGPADTATDQFAFCVSLWEALLHQRPFAGRSVVELAFAMSAGPPRPPSDGPRIPSWLLDAIVRGLSSDAGRRWPSMDALLHALGRDPASRRRVWLQTAAGVCVLGAFAGGLQAWMADRAEQCSTDAAASHLQSIWGEARQAAVHDAMLAVDGPHATDAWAHTRDALDAYASAWARMHVETCEATNVRGEQSASVMELRMACLHRAKVDLGAVTDVLARADATAVGNAHEITASLPPIERCADVEARKAAVEPPPEAQADAVEAIRADIAHARATLKAGHEGDARSAIEAARSKLERVDYGPLQAEVALMHGIVLGARGDHEAAVAMLREALRSASTWRQWAEMEAAAAELVYVVGYQLQRFDEGLRYADLARGLAEGDPQGEARVSTNVALVLEAQGKHERTRRERGDAQP